MLAIGFDVVIIVYDMNIVNSLKYIFTGRENLLNQLSIFSLIGIMVIYLNNCISAAIGTFYSSFLGYPPSDKLVITFNMVAGIVIGIFIFGYTYKFAMNLFKDNKSKLPDISLNSFVVFVKALPVTIVWGIYYLFLFLLSLIFFRIGTLGFYLYNLMILFLYPFVLMICYLYSSGMKKDIFSPLFLFKVIENNIKKVAPLNGQIVVFFVISLIIIVKIFEFSDYFAMLRSFQLGLRIFALCILFYILYIIQLIYAHNLVEILKKD